MAEKPSYEELEQRIKELEKKAFNHREVEEDLDRFDKQMVDMLESEEKYKTLTEKALAGVHIHQDGKIVFANDRFAEMHGYRREELIGKHYLTLIHRDYRELVEQRASQRLNGKDVPWCYEIKKLRKDGKAIWCEIMVTRIQYRGKPAIMGNTVDITDRKRAEEALRESEERYRLLIDNANEAISSIDIYGKYLLMNKSAAMYFRGEPENFIGKTLWDVLPKEVADERMATVFMVIQSGKGQVVEHPLPFQGKEHWFLSSYQPIGTSSGDISSVLILATDITDRKNAEKKIEKSLKEKEVLLREIHHRVKNNMQIVNSLLRLQVKQIKEKKYADMFQDSLDRIQSMALVHEKLYGSKDLTNVDFKAYLQTLVSFLFRSHGVDTNKIAPRIEVKDVSLSIETAIPCALLINELVTNSLKYAFPKDRKGEVRIALRSIGEDDLELIFSDDGIGIPEDLDFRTTESFGMDLIKILGEDQLDGQIELDRTAGTKFHIRFKRQKYRPRV